jgi:hypothetical protein
VVVPGAEDAWGFCTARHAATASCLCKQAAASCRPLAILCVKVVVVLDSCPLCWKWLRCGGAMAEQGAHTVCSMRSPAVCLLAAA